MSNAVVKANSALKVKDLLEKNKSAIAMAVPRHISIDRFFRVAMSAINRTPKLQECTPESLFMSTVQSLTLGLEPSGPLGEAYLIPYYNKDKRMMESQFMPGYRGLINLARRSGDVTLIYAEKVCDGDDYEMERGLEPKLVHKIAIKDRGDAIAYYSVFHTRDGMRDFEFMTLEDVNEIRKRSKSAGSGPWVTDYDEMAKKTVLKRLLKRAPMSVELAIATSADNRASMGENPDYSDLPEFRGVSIDAGPISVMESANDDDEIPMFPVEEVASAN